VTEIEGRALQELLDKQAIHDALMRYCRGVDRCDADLMRSVYHEDAHAFGTNAWEFVDHFVDANRAATTFNMHFMANISVEIDGDVAFSEAYFIAYVGREHDGAEVVDAFAGRYVDRWERRNGVWGVLHRSVAPEWSRGNIAGTEPFPVPQSEQGAFAESRRDRSDLSYRH
jgi:ketosteroid isomerase-like protein